MINTLPSVWYCQRSKECGSQKENAFVVCYPNITHPFTQTIPGSTSLTSSLLQYMANQPNAGILLTVNNQENSLPLLVSGFAREDGPIRPWIIVCMYKGVDCNIKQNSARSDFSQMEGCHWNLESPDVMSIYVKDGKTGFIGGCAWSLNRSSTCSIIMYTSTQ